MKAKLRKLATANLPRTKKRKALMILTKAMTPTEFSQSTCQKLTSVSTKFKTKFDLK
jgi:hypothetical protein